MISDEDVKRLYQIGQRNLANSRDSDEPLESQFYRGVGSHFWKNQHPGSCERHMSIFNRFNIIPQYCFNCYKVFIEPRTVVELFKLMMVFQGLQLVNDNTRKCIVELREQVSGAYKGFVYCTGIDEGKEILKMIQGVVSEQITEKIPVTLKRGCSEYALAYPDYSPTEPGARAMEYNNDWKIYEDRADKEGVLDTNSSVIKTYNQPSYTLHDARIMFAWLSYAAMIGDLSYLEISDRELPTTSNVKRPTQFQPVKD